jgi:pimeloyl-ACP methyl ester carboxylesterase
MRSRSAAIREFFVGDDFPMYVQQWNACADPASGPRIPVSLVHGGAHTGVCWSDCPDGRPGWTHMLADRGWTTFVIDWPGVGRSTGMRDSLADGPRSVVAGLLALLQKIGPSLVIAHSIGATIAAKAMDEAPHLFAGFIALAPAPPGNIRGSRPPAPPEEAIRFDDAYLRQFFCNADRFPLAAFDRYRRTLCGLKPSIFNAVAARNGSTELVLERLAEIAAIPSLVIGAEQDYLVPAPLSRAVADLLKADYVMVGRDWGLPGFGHMMPIEIGSEAILERALEWFCTRHLGRAGP